MSHYSIQLNLMGPTPDKVAKQINSLLPNLVTLEEARDLVLGTKPVLISQVLFRRDRAEQILHMLRNVGANVQAKDENGDIVNFIPVPAGVPTTNPSPQALAAAQAAHDRREREMVERRAREEREARLPLELSAYHRFTLFKRPQGTIFNNTMSPSERVAYQEMVANRAELDRWCTSNLTGLYRLRDVTNAAIYSYTALEVTTDTDAIYVKLWWEDHFSKAPDNHNEWLWDAPSRLFGDNSPSLAYEVDKGEYKHPLGSPFHFSEGVNLGLRGNPWFQPNIETKDRLYALAPAEEQREVFLKFCADYDVMVHSLSDPITESVVEDCLFDAIVSVDHDNMEAFEAIWSTAFTRFRRDSAANAQLAALSTKRVRHA